jgi:hypothetical protein
MARKNYSGSDLSNTWKSWAKKEMNRIGKLLTAKGCTDIDKSYGFYYFTILFTSPSGQTYYMSCSDTRHFGYDKLVFRTTKHYKDWMGGSNQYIGKDEIENIRLN